MHFRFLTLGELAQLNLPDRTKKLPFAQVSEPSRRPSRR